jgi:uncharacterized protein (DUF1330 family)
MCTYLEISVIKIRNQILPVLAFLAIAMSGVGAARAADTAGNHKPAYYIVEFKVTDPEGIKPYSANVESTSKPFGGHFIVRGGGDIASLEGAAVDNRIVVIQFGSGDMARAWYNSPEYTKLRSIRYRSATSRAFIVEGLAG